MCPLVRLTWPRSRCMMPGMHTTLDALRDAIADAIVEAPRHFDDTCHVCAADAVFATPEMQAIRLALGAMAEEVAAAHDEMGVACTPVEVLHDHNLPPSVVAWVLAEGGA